MQRATSIHAFASDLLDGLISFVSECGFPLNLVQVPSRTRLFKSLCVAVTQSTLPGPCLDSAARRALLSVNATELGHLTSPLMLWIGSALVGWALGCVDIV